MDKSKEECYASFEEVMEDLCVYCLCTEYGVNMKAKEASGVSFGCEGVYCKEAYERYLEELKDGESNE